MTDIRTFSIGFESVGKHSGDEFRYSDIIAKRFATDHEQIRIDGRPRARCAARRDCTRCPSRW